MHLHALSPVGRWATGGRDGRWFERFASPTRAMSLAFGVERCRGRAVCRMSRSRGRWHLRPPPAVFSSDHIAGRIGVDEPLHAEPTHDTPAYLLGEREQIGLGEKAGPATGSSRRLRLRAAGKRAGGPPLVGTKTPSVALGSEMHMVIERRSEAVQKGDGTASRASRARPVTVTGRARRSTKQSLYSRDEDPLAREGHDKALSARSTACPAKSEAEDAAGEVRPQFPFDVRRNGLLSDPRGQPRRPRAGRRSTPEAGARWESTAF
jgi:hypothetical protein